MRLPIITEEAGKTFIDAVPRLAWGRGRECTFTGALEAAFAVTPTPFAYEDLMGWAGLAFRVRWFHAEGEPHWSPACPVGELAGEFAALRRATGHEMAVESRIGGVDTNMEVFAPRIAAEIRAGRPVPAHDPTLNMGVIHGFENEGRIVLMRAYMADEPVLRLPAGQLGPFICFLGPRGPALDARTAFLEGIRLGVDSWHGGALPAPEGRYLSGHAALLRWREDLESASDLCVDDKRLLFFVNWWVFDCLADARLNAERFLRRHAAELTGSPHRHLLAAIEAYGEESRTMQAARTGGHAFLGPWTGKELDHWNEGVRAREFALLGRLLEMEATAIGELENLLDTADIPLAHGSAAATA